MRNRNGKSRGLKIVLVACLIAFCSSLSFAADSITGVVRDRTDGQPAVGDEVLLLDPGHGAQEEARAKTDSQGTFNLALHHTGAQYLVRVIHQGVNYDLRAAAGAAISINVYDAASTVQGITGGIEIIRAGTNGNQLHVSEMVEIRNNSNPPITRSGERTFEVYLPANAKIDSVLAAGPENIGTMISAAPASSGLGHYTVNFPLRPGATKFAFNYDLPYSGHAVFRTRSVYPLQQLAVMIPSSMTFKSPSAAFQVLPVGADRYRVEAAEQVNAGEGPQFEIAGVGALPAMQAPAQAQMKPPSGAFGAPPPPTQERPAQLAHSASALGLARLSEPSAASSWVRWWPLGATAALLLGIAGFLAWNRPQRLFGFRTAAAQVAGQNPQTALPLVEALKEGLFQLEADRLQGAISIEAYASTRQALDDTIEWALARAQAQRGGKRS
jgi:hypothetical protein